ncbi:MAG: hypothetical protein AAF467_11645 [Actinomycetota bacterium]
MFGAAGTVGGTGLVVAMATPTGSPGAGDATTPTVALSGGGSGGPDWRLIGGVALAGIVVAVIAIALLAGGGDEPEGVATAEVTDAGEGGDGELAGPGAGDEAEAGTSEDGDDDSGVDGVGSDGAEPDDDAEADFVDDSTTTTESTTTTTEATTTTAFPSELRSVSLTDIAVADGRFEIAYETSNFEPEISRNDSSKYHIHFHWNIYEPESVGSASSPRGDWQLWDVNSAGELIFDAWGPGDVPAGATEICAVVATNTHAVDEPDWAAETVSCVEIPDV